MRASTGLASIGSSRPDLVTSHPEEVDSENWDFTGEDTQYLLHSIHPYPARFVPQIPRRAISRWSSLDDLVLDPFCGSGTTLLEALLSGRDSIGVDNNAVATLVSRAKVAQYDEPSLQAVESLVRKVRARLAGNSVLVPLARPDVPPNYPTRSKWFTPEAVADLSWLRGQIHDLPGLSEELALAVFSSVVVRASNQDSDTRYAATSRQYVPRSALTWWTSRASAAVARAREVIRLRKPSTHTVVTADSRNLPFIEDEGVTLIVTSPPYLNAYDYHKYHRHRLHWIGADVEFARDMEIGGHDVFTRPGAAPEPYFADMEQCMSEWHRTLREGGHALVAVGDAVVSHEFVPVGDRLVKIASALGFSLERRWIRHIDSSRKSFNQSARIKREHLLLFRKRQSLP